MKKKILITGGAGLLGSQWARRIASQYDTHVTINRHDFPQAQVTAHQLDLTDLSQVNGLLSTLKPEIIVNTVGMTNVDECESNPELAFAQNVLTVENLLKSSHAKLIHISTDHLFLGNKGLTKEIDPCEPINVYGKTKRQAEVLCLKSSKNCLIVRTNFFGKSLVEKKSFSDWIYNELTDKNSIEMYTDLYFSPIHLAYLIDYSHQLLDKNCSGIFNVAGSERISKYDFGVALAKMMNLDQGLIKPIRLNEKPKLVVRPKDMSLDVSKCAHELNTKMKSVEESLQFLKYEMRDL